MNLIKDGIEVSEMKTRTVGDKAFSYFTVTYRDVPRHKIFDVLKRSRILNDETIEDKENYVLISKEYTKFLNITIEEWASFRAWKWANTVKK